MPMSASKLERAKQAASRLRTKVRGGDVVSGISAFGAGLTAGVMEKSNIVPAVALGGMPTKPIGMAIAWYLASRSSIGGTGHSVFRGIGDGLSGAYGYASGKSGTLIAGDEYIGAEDDDEEVEADDAEVEEVSEL